jgi:two-component system cell cycle sensor histidine kinase PleC
MKRAPVLTFAEDLPAAALSSLAADGAAAWLIDVAGGRIPAANAAGAALLGLDYETSLPLLDAAMPALARLRALARESGRGDAAPERLVFWTRTGAVRPRCRVEILGTWPQALALVTALGDADGCAAAPPGASFAGDDTAKLKEIARRIREGQMTRLKAARRRRHDIGLALPSGDKPSSPTGPAPSLPVSLRASLAHELKTPVSAIAAAAEIMKDERFGPLGTPRYVGYAADIHASAQHVLSVIDRMLAEGGNVKPDAPPRDLDITQIDMGKALEAAVSQLVPLAERAGITLTLDLAPRLPHVIADATSLRQMVFNLVTNALKFTDRGGRITVSAHYNGDGPLSIAVSDTGSGMPQGQIERLLGPDRAGRPNRPAGAEGLGLGLPLVQALAAANGAELCIESTPGQGTSASVVFAKGRVVPV